MTLFEPLGYPYGLLDLGQKECYKLHSKEIKRNQENEEYAWKGVHR